jgi:spore maturation protein CgeB
MSSNIKVHVGGGQREQPVPVKQYADMFKRSKIVLNFSRHAYGYYQHKGRVFEATLCGALLLESENPETEKWLIPMRDYVPFKDEADLVDKVTYFLAHESERQRIANNGCSKATEKYTGETFWRTILSRLVFLS